MAEDAGDPNAIARLPLKIELLCELYEFLPLEYAIHYLQLNNELMELNVNQVQRKSQIWTNFRDSRLNTLVQLFHTDLPMRIQQLRNAVENVGTGADDRFRLGDLEDKRCMDIELEEMKQWVAPQAIRDGLAMEKREKVMDHFLWCTVNLYSFMNKNNYRIQKAIQSYDDDFQTRASELHALCAPHAFPSGPNWDFSPLVRERLTWAYKMKLDGWSEEILNIQKARMEKLLHAPWRQKYADFDNHVRSNIKTLHNAWKKARKQKDDFNANAWLAELEEDQMEMSGISEAEQAVEGGK